MRQQQLDHVFGLIQKVVELVFVRSLDSLLLKLVVNLYEDVKRSLVVRDVLNVDVHPGKQQLLDAVFFQIDAREMECSVAQLLGLAVLVVYDQFLVDRIWYASFALEHEVDNLQS